MLLDYVRRTAVILAPSTVNLSRFCAFANGTEVPPKITEIAVPVVLATFIPFTVTDVPVESVEPVGVYIYAPTATT